MASEPSCAINSWEFLGSLSDRWLPTNGFAVWCVGLSVISSSSHARADAHLLECYSFTSANAFWKRNCLSRLCIINSTVYRSSVFEADIYFSRDVLVNTLRGWKLDGSFVIAGDVYCNRFVQLKKSNFCCLPERMELYRTSVLTKDVHQWFCGYYYHVSSGVYSTFCFVY